MAYMSNQWLKGDKDRERGSQPCRVDLQMAWPNGEWDKDHGILLEACGIRHDGNYQYVLLTDRDVERFAYAALASERTRDILAKAISRRDGDELLAIIEKVATLRRERSPRSDDRVD